MLQKPVDPQLADCYFAADAISGHCSSGRRRSRHRLTRPGALAERSQVARRSNWDAGFLIFSASWIDNLATDQIMRHTISVLVENKFGVLTRIAGLFSGRGYNIDTLNVGPTQDPETSRMTIVTRGNDATLEQIVKQLNKLVEVLDVRDFRDYEYIDRELVLVRVGVDSKSRAEVMQITDIFRAKIVDVQPKSLTIEITGSEGKVEKFLELMKTFGVRDLTRTGKVALPRA